MGRNWTRNLPLKIGAVVAAIAGTLGFYGLIQAHPLGSESTSSVAATTTGVAGAAGAAGDQQQVATPVPPGDDDSGQQQPIEQTPQQQTIPRQRVSRGS
jgi:hypothetical protein